MTDHRTEADKWLHGAATLSDDAALYDSDDPGGKLIGFDPEFQVAAQTAALIGIGHALLAGSPLPPRVITFNAPVTEAEIQRVKAALKDDR